MLLKHPKNVNWKKKVKHCLTTFCLRWLIWNLGKQKNFNSSKTKNIKIFTFFSSLAAKKINTLRKMFLFQVFKHFINFSLGFDFVLLHVPFCSILFHFHVPFSFDVPFFYQPAFCIQIFRFAKQIRSFIRIEVSMEGLIEKLPKIVSNIIFINWMSRYLQ